MRSCLLTLSSFLVPRPCLVLCSVLSILVCRCVVLVVFTCGLYLFLFFFRDGDVGGGEVQNICIVRNRMGERYKMAGLERLMLTRSTLYLPSFFFFADESKRNTKI